MKRIALLAGALLCASAAHAQTTTAPDEKKWTGEGAFGAGVTTGNTDTIDVSVALKLAREAKNWKLSTEGGYEFGQTDGIDTRNRWYVAGQYDRDFSPKLFGFARVSYEEDAFSGFDSRLFLGAGLGYKIFDEEKLRWTVDAAPGFRIDDVSDSIDPGPPEVIIPGGAENNIAVRGGSAFAYDFNDNVGFTNDTSVVWSDVSTQTINTSALDAQLTKALKARISFQVRNDTNPPIGFVNTDTATRVSVVYGF
ncbi:MAG: DUF481 domain-containing protein [Pseudomonadota bacterium]